MTRSEAETAIGPTGVGPAVVTMSTQGPRWFIWNWNNYDRAEQYKGRTREDRPDRCLRFPGERDALIGAWMNREINIFRFISESTIPLGQVFIKDVLSVDGLRPSIFMSETHKLVLPLRIDGPDPFLAGKILPGNATLSALANTGDWTEFGLQISYHHLNDKNEVALTTLKLLY